MADSRERLRNAFSSVPKADDVYGVKPPTGGPPPRQRVPENAIVRRDDGTMVYKRFEMTPVGLVLPEDTTQDEWIEVGQIIKLLETSISWIAGDWANYAYQKWEVAYDIIAQEFGYAVETLYTYAGVCRVFPTSIRNRGVSFGHHRAVVGMKDEGKRQSLLQAAAAQGLTIKQMLESASQAKPALPAVSPLAAKVHRETFNRLWGALERGKKIRKDDIQRLRRWLDEIERGL